MCYEFGWRTCVRPFYIGRCSVRLLPSTSEHGSIVAHVAVELSNCIA